MKKIAILLIALMVVNVGLLSGCNEQTAIEQENNFSNSNLFLFYFKILSTTARLTKE